METINALKVRQSFGKVLKNLQKKNEPILIEKGRTPVAVLISLTAFKERFVDYREKEKREALVQLAKKSATSPKKESLKVLRELRYGLHS